METEADLESRARAAVRTAFGLPDGVIREQVRFTFRFGRQTLVVDAREARADARLDILLELAGRPLAVMELKRPGLELTAEDAEQGLSYARLVQPPAPLVVVTNGTDVEFYETYSGATWEPSDRSEATLKSLFKSASRVAAGDIKRAVETLMGVEPSVWMQAVRLVSADTIKELTTTWDEPGRPFIEGFMAPRGATQELLTHLLTGEKLLVVKGTPLSGKSNVLRELCRKADKIDTIATLYIDARTRGAALQKLADALARPLNWPVTPQEARDWLVRLSNSEGRRLALVFDGLRPWDENVVREVEDLSSSTFGPALSVVVAVDEATLPQLLRAGNHRGDSPLGRRAKLIHVGPLMDNEFAVARALLARRRVLLMQGAEYSHDYRQPWVLRSIASDAHDVLKGGPEDKALSLPSVLGLRLIEVVRQQFTDERPRRIFRALAKAMLNDAQDPSRPADFVLAQIEHSVIRRDAVSEQLDSNDMQWLFDNGFARAAMQDTIGATVWVRLPELLASELAYLIGDELMKRASEHIDKASAWLAGAAGNLPLGEIVCAQAIVDAGQQHGGVPIGIISRLISRPPEREELNANGSYRSMLSNGAMMEITLRADGANYITIDGVRHEVDIADEMTDSYKDVHPWMILSHLASKPFEVEQEEGPVRGDASLLLEIGTCPMPLHAARGQQSQRMIPMVNYSRDVSTVNPDVGIVEVITLGILNYLAAEVDEADAWLDKAVSSRSVALLTRVYAALRVLDGFEGHARSQWAKSMLRELVLPALKEAAAEYESGIDIPEEGDSRVTGA
nr:type I restriction endonuclease [uncultured Hydrogenophaga sp.]